MTEAWQCACGEWTTATHWRHGADGSMFHASPDAPPSDDAPIINEATTADSANRPACG